MNKNWMLVIVIIIAASVLLTESAAAQVIPTSVQDDLNPERILEVVMRTGIWKGKYLRVDITSTNRMKLKIKNSRTEFISFNNKIFFPEDLMKSTQRNTLLKKLFLTVGGKALKTFKNFLVVYFTNPIDLWQMPINSSHYKLLKLSVALFNIYLSKSNKSRRKVSQFLTKLNVLKYTKNMNEELTIRKFKKKSKLLLISFNFHGTYNGRLVLSLGIGASYFTGKILNSFNIGFSLNLNFQHRCFLKNYVDAAISDYSNYLNFNINIIFKFGVYNPFIMSFGFELDNKIGGTKIDAFANSYKGAHIEFGGLFFKKN